MVTFLTPNSTPVSRRFGLKICRKEKKNEPQEGGPSQQSSSSSQVKQKNTKEYMGRVKIPILSGNHAEPILLLLRSPPKSPRESNLEGV